MATATAAASDDPYGPSKGIAFDVHTQLNRESAEQTALAIRNAVSEAIRGAVHETLFGLSLTIDERAMLEKYRADKAVNIQNARARINADLNAGKAV